jgi:hypothetical protein
MTTTSCFGFDLTARLRLANAIGIIRGWENASVTTTFQDSNQSVPSEIRSQHRSFRLWALALLRERESGPAETWLPDDPFLIACVQDTHQRRAGTDHFLGKASNNCVSVFDSALVDDPRASWSATRLQHATLHHVTSFRGP